MQVLLKGGECGPQPSARGLRPDWRAQGPEATVPTALGQSPVGGVGEGRAGPCQGHEGFSKLDWALSLSPGFWEP